PCKKAGLSAEQCGDRTLPGGKQPKQDRRGQVITQWMLPGPPTQFNVTENLPGMGMQLRATDSRIVIPWTAERRLVDARVSGLMDSPGKLLTQFFEVLTSSSLAPSLLSSSEYRPGHALDLQHTGTSSTGDFTGASNNIGLSPLPKQI